MTSDVSVTDVRKSYKGVVAVDGVSFEVPPTSFFSLLGPSGCGKTTILRMIAGFVTPDAGDVSIRGVPVTTAPPYRRDTAMVFQNYALFPHMTVFDNVAFGLRYRAIPSRERSNKIGRALERVRLTGHDRRFPSQLSGGQQQRVALARAIVVEPALLLLDEPLSNLDLRLRQQMRNELRAIQSEVQITTIYVTHDQAEAFSMSDQIAVMNRGKIIQIGTPNDIYLRPADEFVVTFIGETNRFTGTVLARDEAGINIKTDEGLDLRVASSVASDRLPIGSRCAVFFREEQVRLANSPGNSNSFPGAIDTIQNLGTMHTYTVRLASGPRIRSTSATTHSDSRRLGQDVFVELDPGDCVLVAEANSAGD